MTVTSVHSAAIDEFVERARQHWRVPGLAVAALHKGEPVHVKAYGVKSLDTGDPADIDTAFAIASCSKAFTATLAAALVGDGKLGWDDPIRKYLPEFRLYDPWISDRVTIRDMLANRTGLSRACPWECSDEIDRHEVLRRAAETQPLAGFRDQYAYSNIGFVVAAEAMARAAGRPFETLLEERILAPLGMSATKVAPDAWRRATNIAVPHHQLREVPRARGHWNGDGIVGAGSMIMTAGDAMRWLKLQLGGGRIDGVEIVARDAFAETHFLQVAARDRQWFDGYGLGWWIQRLPSGRCVYHDGALEGSRARIRLDLDQDFACFTAINLDSPANQPVSNFTFRQVSGLEQEDWIAKFDGYAEHDRATWKARIAAAQADDAAQPSRWASGDFAGRYRHWGFGTIAIEERADDTLWLSVAGDSWYDGPLVRYGAHAFEYQGDGRLYPERPMPTKPQGMPSWVEFTEAAGRITGCIWRGMWFGEARCERL